MQVKRFAKWGLALTSTLVLSGVVAQVGGNLVNNSTVVHAEEIQSRVAVHAGYYFNGELVFAAFDLEEFWVSPGESRSIVVPAVDGYVYEGKYLLSNRNGERLLQGSPSARYEDTVGSSFVDVILIYAPVDKPVDTPTEQPTEQPAETPAEQPAEQPISVAVIAISESDGPLSHHYITINPGETKTVETPKVDGYKLDQYTSPTYELTYDNALKQLNSAGFAWVQFWMIKDAAPETPVEQPTEQPVDQPVETPADQPADQPTEQPAEQPTEQPVEQLAEQVVDTPTDKPVEQLTDASSLTDQPAGKVQVVAATDKKTVDKSAPSTPAVKPQEVSQPVTKTLPKTGDNFSMLLVLGGVLSGLSGLGLAATSRKRD